MKTRNVILGVALLGLPLLSPTGGDCAQAPVPDTLRPGIARADTLGPDETRKWRVPADSNEVILVAVRQPSDGVALRLTSPEGVEAFTGDPTTWPVRHRVLAWTSSTDGDWILEVAPFGAAPTGYGIELVSRGPAEEFEVGLFQGSFRDAGFDAEFLSRVGNLYYRGGRYRAAEAFFRAGLDFAELAREEDPSAPITWLSDLGIVLENQGRFREALEAYERTLEIERSILAPDDPRIGAELSNLGVVLYRLGRYEEARARFERSAAIFESAIRQGTYRDYVEVGGWDFSLFLATALANLGTLLHDMGDYADAEAIQLEAIRLHERADEVDELGLSAVLSNLGLLYDDLGRERQAEGLFERSLTLDVPPVEHGPAMVNLARLYLEQGRYERAEELLEEALGLFDGVSMPAYAAALLNLGRVQAARGRLAQAERSFLRALEILRESYPPGHPEIAMALLRLSETLIQVPDPDLERIRSLLDEAIGINRNNPAMFPDVRVDAHALRARVHRASERSEEAFRDLEEALRLAESLRPNVSGGAEGRARFFARFAPHFDRMVDWQIAEGRIVEAFRTLERGRANLLVQQLQMAGISLIDHVRDPEVRERLDRSRADAVSRLSEYQLRLTILRGDSESGQGAEARFAALEDSLRAAERDFVLARDAIQSASELWKQISAQGEFVGLGTARDLVPPVGMMLVYQIGADASHLFAIDRREPPAVLPLVVSQADAAELGVEAGPLTSERLAAIGPLRADASADGARGLEDGIGSAFDAARMAALWRILVPESIRPRLLAADVAVVVPDDHLYQLPFEALVSEPGDDPSRTRFWLDVGPPIVYLPSVTVLSRLTPNPAGGARRAIVTLSDAIFDSRAVEQAGEVVAGVARSDRGGTLAPLPGTAVETEAIVEAVGEDPSMGPVIALQREKATERNLRAAFPDARYLHLGTHGLVEEGRADIFAALALTAGGGRTTAEDDGFLQLYEIYELDLRGLELAVLSACESNVGEIVEGEGIFALSRGFLAAGVRRVIATQWRVDDASSAALVGGYFRAVIEAAREGMPIDHARALHEAKRAVRADPRWSASFHWAPYILTGSR